MPGTPQKSRRFLVRVITAIVLSIVVAPLRANLMSFSFSGTWQAGNVSTLGLLSAGDTFSGTLTWDTTGPNACPGSTAFSECVDLTSLTLNLPAGTGLSVPNLPDSQLNFAGALYVGTPPVLLDFQVNDQSSVDSQFYIFEFFPHGGAVSNVTFTDSLVATGKNFVVTGPTAIPEPKAGLLAVIAMGIAVAWRRRPLP